MQQPRILRNDKGATFGRRQMRDANCRTKGCTCCNMGAGLDVLTQHPRSLYIGNGAGLAVVSYPACVIAWNGNHNCCRTAARDVLLV